MFRKLAAVLSAASLGAAAMSGVGFTLAAGAQDAVTCQGVVNSPGEYTKALVTTQKEGEVFKSGVNLSPLENRVVAPGASGKISLVVCNNGATDGLVSGLVAGETAGDVADKTDPFYKDLKIGKKPFTEIASASDPTRVVEDVPLKRGESMVMEFPYEFPADATSGNAAGGMSDGKPYAPGTRSASLKVNVVLRQDPDAKIPGGTPGGGSGGSSDPSKKPTPGGGSGGSSDPSKKPTPGGGSGWEKPPKPRPRHQSITGIHLDKHIKKTTPEKTTWIVTVTNKRTGEVRNITVTDAGLDPNWGKPSIGKIDGNKWRIPFIPAGQSLSREVETKTGEENTAWITGEGQNPDKKPDDPESIAQATKLAVHKTYESSENGKDKWRITIENLLGEDATNLEVIDNFKDATWDKPTLGKIENNKWVIPGLKKNEQATAHVSTFGVNSNRACASTQKDRDNKKPVSALNCDTAHKPRKSNGEYPPDVQVYKEHVETRGETDVWRITVTNQGEGAAENFEVKEAVAGAKWGKPTLGVIKNDRWLVDRLEPGGDAQVLVETGLLDQNFAWTQTPGKERFKNPAQRETCHGEGCVRVEKPGVKPSPDATKTPDPDKTRKPTPGVTKTPDPDKTREPQPDKTRKPTPDATKTPTPDATKTPNPDKTRKPEDPGVPEDVKVKKEYKRAEPDGDVWEVTVTNASTGRIAGVQIVDSAPYAKWGGFTTGHAKGSKWVDLSLKPRETVTSEVKTTGVDENTAWAQTPKGRVVARREDCVEACDVARKPGRLSTYTPTPTPTRSIPGSPYWRPHYYSTVTPKPSTPGRNPKIGGGNGNAGGGAGGGNNNGAGGGAGGGNNNGNGGGAVGGGGRFASVGTVPGLNNGMLTAPPVLTPPPVSPLARTGSIVGWAGAVAAVLCAGGAIAMYTARRRWARGANQ